MSRHILTALFLCLGVQEFLYLEDAAFKLAGKPGNFEGNASEEDSRVVQKCGLNLGRKRAVQGTTLRQMHTSVRKVRRPHTSYRTESLVDVRPQEVSA